MGHIRTKLKKVMQDVCWFIDYFVFNILHPIKKKIPSNFSRILIVEYMFIGDIIVALPVAKALKAAYKEAKISFFTRAEMKDVVSFNPYIDEVLTFSKKEIINEMDKIIKILKEKRFDLVVLLHPGIDIGNFKMSLLLKKACIPFRVGCTKVGIREGKGFFLHRKTKPTFKLKHKIDDNLDVIKVLGIDYDIIEDAKVLSVYTTDESERFISQFKKENKIGDYVVLHAAPQHKSHEWLAERFADVAEFLLSNKIAVVFTGSKKDFLYNERIISMIKSKSMVKSSPIGKYAKMVFNVSGTSLKEFFSVVKHSKFVISVDTSAMHVAAAFDKPIISLFGAGNPMIWRPYNKTPANSVVLYAGDKRCTSCMRHKCLFSEDDWRFMECMKYISVSDVIGSIKKFI